MENNEPTRYPANETASDLSSTERPSVLRRVARGAGHLLTAPMRAVHDSNEAFGSAQVDAMMKAEQNPDLSQPERDDAVRRLGNMHQG